jgi:hypothetical protein
MSGAMSSPSTPLHNKTGHSTLTSGCRNTTSFSNANNEKILTGNRHYYNVNIILNNLVFITSKIKLKDIENEEVKRTLELVNPKILKNCDLITNQDFNIESVLHISMRTLPYLTPTVSKIANEQEDNTLPRVHTAKTFFECLIGRGLLSNRANEQVIEKQKRPRYNEFTGVMLIYSIPFEYALKPNSILVFDASATNELWLFTYNKDTRTFYPTQVHEFIQTKVTLIPGTKETFKTIYTVVMNVVEGGSVNIDNKVILKPGYYELEIEEHFSADKDHDFDFTLVNYKKSNKESFSNSRKNHTALESFSEKRKLLLNW